MALSQMTGGVGKTGQNTEDVSLCLSVEAVSGIDSLGTILTHCIAEGGCLRIQAAFDSCSAQLSAVRISTKRPSCSLLKYHTDQTETWNRSG